MPGLVNLGNTCFISSVVQAMAGSKDVVAASQASLQSRPLGSLGRSAGELIMRLSGSEKGVISPSELITRIREKYKNIGFAQQDAEEAFLIITDALFCRDKADYAAGHRQGLAFIEELCRAGKPYRSLAPPPCSADDSLFAPFVLIPASSMSAGPDIYEGILTQHTLADRSLPVYRAPVVVPSPLGGLLASAVRCALCGGHRELRMDPFSDISLAIPLQRQRFAGRGKEGFLQAAGLTVSDCLEEWATDEVVDGALCDRCLLEDAIGILSDRKAAFGSIAASLSVERRRELELTLEGQIELLELVRPIVRKHACLPDAVRSQCRKVIGDKSAGRLVKKLTIMRPPAVLALHLRRVLPTLTGFRKDSTPVSFAPVLDIAPFCTVAWGGAGGKLRYHLVGVVQHFGDAYGGHYISYRRDADGEGWTLCNDANLSKVTLSQVLSAEAYMLIYERAAV